MPNAIVVHEFGGPEVMKWEEVALPKPGPGEAHIAQTKVGLNFIDVYQRNGVYPLDLPATIGMEGVGIVDAIGDGVDEVKPGDRVGYVMGPAGSYAESRVYPASRLIKLPDDIDDATAAAMLLKGLTAAYLLTRTYQVKKGDTVLFHAAAGGVGLIACQWLDKIGANVIGTVSSEEKAELAKAHGCHNPVIYTKEDFADKVLELTSGEGVPVVYDGVGKDTFDGSLKALGDFGTLVSFGAASGAPPAVPVKLLAGKALYLTRPGLAPHTATPERTQDLADRLFQAVRDGVKIEINQIFALRDAAAAHSALENRQTTGSTIFNVD